MIVIELLCLWLATKVVLGLLGLIFTWDAFWLVLTIYGVLRMVITLSIRDARKD